MRRFSGAAARNLSGWLVVGAALLSRPLIADDGVSIAKLTAEVADALRQTVSRIAATGERLRFCAAQVTARENQLRDIAVKTIQGKTNWNDLQRQMEVANAKLANLRRVPASVPEANELRRQLQALDASIRDYRALADRLREEDEKARADLRQQQECTRTSEQMLKTMASQTGNTEPVPK